MRVFSLAREERHSGSSLARLEAVHGTQCECVCVLVCVCVGVCVYVCVLVCVCMYV